ncbi:MAG TPA: aldolase/citrate lyase family protein [Candidatus Cybelea sp.]|nr:aldolase/citrate lyase family protein [Candidatus Cybelea sp.]
MTVRSIKERLKSGEKILAGWLYGLGPVTTEVMAVSGYGALLIDQEHGPVDVQTIHVQLLAAQAHGVPTMVRVPSHDPNHVKRLLDLGVQTIMFPMVDALADAKAIAAACRYPPVGRRGIATGGIRASRYGVDTKDYLDHYTERQLIMAQIETLGGLEAVEEIAAVDGIDLLFVGPNDLSAAMGHLGEMDHPSVRKAIDRIVAAAKAKGKFLGTVPTKERDAKTLFAAGFDMVASGSDVSLLREAAVAHVKAQGPAQNPRN